ncbi:MAG: DUF2617 family protein [Planctomycetaceae bacterium]
MKATFTRPGVSSLVFHLYGRSVHPELLQAYAEADVPHERYHAGLKICEAGHAVSFRLGKQCVTEVTATRQQCLPLRKRLLERRLQGCHDAAHSFEGGLTYQVSFQLEQLDAEVFHHVHEELLADCARADLACRFPSSSRWEPEPLSLLRAEASARGFLLHAFHTFPDQFAVVRTQSLFEF